MKTNIYHYYDDDDGNNNNNCGYLACPYIKLFKQ